jgi:hypothetical protein
MLRGSMSYRSMANRRLNETISVRMSTEERGHIENEGVDASRFLRMAAKILISSINQCGTAMLENLVKNRQTIPDPTQILLPALRSHLEAGQLDTQLQVQESDGWWFWLIVDGLRVRYGAVKSLDKKGHGIPFRKATGFGGNVAAAVPAAEFSEWCDLTNYGHVWSFGEACDG